MDNTKITEKTDMLNPAQDAAEKISNLFYDKMDAGLREVGIEVFVSRDAFAAIIAKAYEQQTEANAALREAAEEMLWFLKGPSNPSPDDFRKWQDDLGATGRQAIDDASKGEKETSDERDNHL